MRAAARGVLSLVVAVAAAGAATHTMGLWQLDGTGETAPRTRPVREPVAVDGRSVTVLGAGSIVPSAEVADQARRDGGYGPLLAAARPAVTAADVALCHVDAPEVPPELADALADTGFNGCSTTARGQQDALDNAKIGQAPRLYRVDGVKVAHLAYTVPKTDGIKADARRARQAGAAIVVVDVGWGSAGEQEPDATQQTLAREIAAMDDVDVVLGHGAHAVQPVERVAGKWIVYGTGDLVSRFPEPVNENREGAMMRITFTPKEDTGRWTVRAIEAIPTFVALNPQIRAVDLEQALADPGLSEGRRQLYEAAVERIQGQLLTRGGARSTVIVRGTAA